MSAEQNFFKSVCMIAIPITIQSTLEWSFSIVDQIMIGQLGSTSITAIGLAGKFSSIFSVLLSAVASIAGIMIAQYLGKKDKEEVNRSFWVNLILGMMFAFLFLFLSAYMPQKMMGLYTTDPDSKEIAAKYLSIISIAYIPRVISILLSTVLRNMEKSIWPMFATFLSAIMNTFLNYILIFGKFHFPAYQVEGAAIATVIAQCFECVFIGITFFIVTKKNNMHFFFDISMKQGKLKQYIWMLIPILMTEFFWSLGENVYTSIYGHIGTKECAAMTLTVPIQCLVIGALSGIAQAAAIMIGKLLGTKEYGNAYKNAKKMLKYGWMISIVLSICLLISSKFYVTIYQVDENVKNMAVQILIAFAIVSPMKVQNMILGGGIIRSGGKTKYVMWIDLIGTWMFGVPLGLFTAFVLKLPIPYVYFILSMEECVRFFLSLFIFKRKKWMESLKD